MQEESYVNILVLEPEEAPQAVSGVQPPSKCLSYSTGRFRNGATGLCNIGTTSCLNPLLQTLYMNKEFTGILCRIGDPDDNMPPDSRLPYELLALFEEMQNSKEDAVAPYRFLHHLQILRATVYTQNDVAEVFSTLLSLLLRTTPNPQLTEKMRALYTIQLGERITCQRCSQQRAANSDLLAISLRISYSKFLRKLTLERTLRRYFRSHETHDDRNLCSKCKSSRIVKVTHLRSLPRTLNIHLKRLSQKNPLQKVNRTLSFPPVLNLREVLDPEHLPPEEYSMLCYNYRLFAVVAHSGTGGLGHFCCYINSHKDGRWYFFNDSSVCRVSWDDVKCTYGNTTFRWGVTACLLVYVQSDAATDDTKPPM
ncbi:ubl carboxyl-terminal hydrolase 18 isoform X1 [Rana temporaria]|uniref:ubl carboxyl-terminal hydrolase 18 isoform X1 n=1 Tax=Rana temporaria TaxID=8407 RepID=UPI001AAD4A39|nr:ubl carboxyl-terminal hydrolase 18 isoform X1 [Rana temporaria]XP_040201294.1 ubl carboxyl-terminal hydrolase 18 isoform X1 [Rana temporaria]